MRKIYTFLMMVVAFMSSLTANAWGEFTITFKNPDHIDLVMYNNQSVSFTDQVQVTPDWMGARELLILPKAGFKIDSWELTNMWGEGFDAGELKDDGTLFVNVTTSGFGDAKMTVYTSAAGEVKEMQRVLFELNDDAVEAITRVTANGVVIEKTAWSDPDGFEVEKEAKVVLELNTNDYRIDLFEIDGEATNAREFTADADKTVKINAHKYGSYTVTVNGDRKYFTISTGTTLSNCKPISYEGFSFEVDEKQPYICVERNAGYKITSFEDGEGNQLPQKEMITVKGNMTLNIEGDELVYDQKLHVYLYNGWLSDSPELVTNDGISHSLKDGYQTIDFAEEDNIVTIKVRNLDEKIKLNTAYLNDEPQNGGDFTWNFYYIPVKNNDVITVFVNDEPEKYDVNINSTAKAPFKVLRHNVVETEDSSFQMHLGTQITILPTSDQKIKVSYDVATDDAETRSDEKDPNVILPGEDGTYNFVIKSPLSLKIEDAEESGVNEIESSASADAAIYNLQGIRVSGDLRTLPAGIYVVNGKKVVK